MSRGVKVMYANPGLLILLSSTFNGSAPLPSFLLIFLVTEENVLARKINFIVRCPIRNFKYGHKGIFVKIFMVLFASKSCQC